MYSLLVDRNISMGLKAASMVTKEWLIIWIDLDHVILRFTSLQTLKEIVLYISSLLLELLS